MRIPTLAALAALTLTLTPLGAAAQPGAALADEAAIRQQYAQIDASIVRIRTIARLPAEPGVREREPLSVIGTGVVIGTLQVDGQTEYLILTNHHVADASNYVIQDGPFLRENKRNSRAFPTAPEESYVVAEDRDEIMPDDVRLMELSRNVRGDFALLRTVGAQRPLVPFAGAIGYGAEGVPQGAPIITSGYPYTGGKVLALGTVLETDRHHALGQPHVDFTVDLPVARGQSGSPVFHVQATPGGAYRFTLIGLIHAAERDDRFMVPFALWQESLEPVREALGSRLPAKQE